MNLSIPALRRPGFVPEDVGCTMLLSQIRYAGLDGVKHGLQNVANKFLDVEMAKDKQASDWTKDPLDTEQIEYAALDSKHLLDLYEEEVRVLEHVGLDTIKELEEQVLPVVVEISETGMPVDEERWSEVIEEARQRIVDLRDEMDAYMTNPLPEDMALRNQKSKSVEEGRKDKVNWSSSDQKIWAVELLGLEVPTRWDHKKKEKRKTLDKNHLHLIDHSIAELLLEHQAIQNLPSTYLKAIEERVHVGYIYPDWNQLKARTGRMSCENPPMHNVPKKLKLREAVVASEGHKLISCDLSQIEPRVLAALSKDESLLKAYRRGEDLYAFVARRVTGDETIDKSSPLRDIFKTIVLGMIYGMSPVGLEIRLNRDLQRAS